MDGDRELTGDFENFIRARNRCHMCQTLSPEYLAAVARLRAEGKAQGAVRAWLRARGHALSRAQMRHHWEDCKGGR